MKKIIIILIIILLVIAGYEFLNQPKTVQNVGQTAVSQTENTGEPKSKNLVLTENKAYCFVYKQKATENAPYEVTEHIKISRSGNIYTGTKSGTQSGPDMSNGYEGTLSGENSRGEIYLVFDYTIEGSQNKELEIYTLGADKLIKKRYPLSEGIYQGKKMIVPDQSSTPTLVDYKLEDCQ